MGAAEAAARPPAAARVFVGRAEELSELHAALRHAAAGRCHTAGRLGAPRSGGRPLTRQPGPRRKEGGALAAPLSPGTWDPGPVHPGRPLRRTRCGGLVRQRAADAGPGARGGGAPGGRHILRYGHAPAKPGEAARRARRDRTASPAPARASHGVPARLLAAGQVVASDPASPPITGSAAARCPATGLNSPADRTPQPRPRQGQSVLGRRGWA